MDVEQPAAERRTTLGRWLQQQRWVGVALVLPFTGLAPAPPQLPPRPPEEFQQADDDPLSSGCMPTQPPDQGL
jgi:hypothetical protein